MSDDRRNRRTGVLALLIGVALVGAGWAFWNIGGAAFIVVGVVVIIVGLVLAAKRPGAPP